MAKETAVAKVWTPTAKEKEFLANVQAPDVTIDVLVPDEIDVAQWKFETGVVCKVLGEAQRRTEVFVPVLGRLLNIARESEVIREGYDTFELFLEGEVYGNFGVGRSTAYEAMQIASRWSALPISEFEAVGRVNLGVIGKVIEKGKEKTQKAIGLLEKAKEMTTKQLKDYCEDKGWLEKGETSGATIRIPCSKATEKKWKTFIGDARVQAVVGNGKPDSILKALMEEASSEWLVRGQEKLNAQSEEVEEPEVVEA